MDDPEDQYSTDGLKFGSGEARLLSETTSKGTQVHPQVKVITKKKKQPNHYDGYLKLCLCGLSIMGLAYAIHFIDPISVIKNIMLSMSEGSYLFKMWKSPPIKLYIKVYIFNITNANEFLDGRDSKIKLQEIGPYTYSETIINEDIEWNENSTISFTPRRKVVFEPELSAGDPYKDVITVTNVPLLGIASALHNSSIGINLALSTIISYLDARPLLNRTVDAFLWGYDDPLVKLASNVLPTWINFERFGLLDRMMDEGENRITMLLENTNTSSQYSIENYNGSPGLSQWGYDAGSNVTRTCDRVTGSVEGILFPRNLQPSQSFTVYRKAFCRSLPIVFDRQEKTKAGYPAYVYTFPKDILDPENPNNKCYCDRFGRCLPPGLSDLSPCYYNIPVAISLPHFIYANKSLGSRVEGLNPNPEKHGTVFAVQPEIGVPLFVRTRVQLNIVVKKTKFIPRVKNFDNMVIPIFWLQVELVSLPDSVLNLLSLLLIYGPVIQTSSIVLLFILGLGLVFTANIRYAWRSGLFAQRRQQAALISYRQKNKANVRIVWKSSTYAQILPKPVPTHIVESGR
ncbi:scavenger receptor class B member 1-like isoform X2 [Cimex lectularius]|nr:scavenger receptor class B member 1-like isoform X2 [Cimex lectularius]